MNEFLQVSIFERDHKQLIRCWVDLYCVSKKRANFETV